MVNVIDNELAPTLFVGLGGQGCKLIELVYKRANEKQKKYLSFVGFDTDANELNQIRTNNPQIRTIQTSTVKTVGEYLNQDKHSLDNWFPVHNVLLRKTPSEGAGQVRAISRLVMDTAIRNGDLEPLHEAIDDLFRLSSGESRQATRIVIVSSLAGGTGSGLILPISMYIKNYLEGSNSCIIRGFFLLPEVMDSVIKNESERKNLYCNAYATVREIDAFMQKSSDNLDKRYEGLSFEVPKVGCKDEFEVYNCAPFDFCFLFSRQNIENEKMKSKDDVLEHAANCIYAQSIGPTTSRQNSSEDNTLLERIRSNNRNNYCGAGASTLEYPYEDMKAFIAFNWAKSTINQEWLSIDREYYDQLREAQEARARGHYSGVVKQKDYYINFVEVSNNPFPKQIIHDSRNYGDDGFTEKSRKWEEYVKYLGAYSITRGKRLLESFDVAIERITQYINTIRQDAKDDKDKANFIQILNDLELIYNIASQRGPVVGASIGDALFLSTRKPVKQITKNNKEMVESMFIRDDGLGMIHPSSIRYLLYKTTNYLESIISSLKEQIKTLEDNWSKFNNNTYAIEGKNGNVQPIEYISTVLFSNKNNIRNRKKIKTLRAGFLDNLKDMKKDIIVYLDYVIQLTVFEEALTYVNKLSKAFQTFYQSLDNGIEVIDKNIEAIEKKYPDLDSDKPVRYVCATKECLKFMNKRAVNLEGVNEVPGELCASIYEKVLNYAVISSRGDITYALSTLGASVQNEEVDDKDIHVNRDEQQIEYYFRDVLDKTILSYWKQVVATNCNELINMDIIEAIEKEGEILRHYTSRDDKKNYVREVISRAKNLAIPFIDTPQDNQPRIIDSCTFNPVLLKSDYDDRKQIVVDELINFGGVASSLTHKSTVVFFRSIYDLRAQDFRRFSPPKSSETLEQKAGNYFRAYYDRIARLLPNKLECDEITPHIHKNWHLIVSLPDLNPDYQIQLEKEICTAFIISLLFEYIEYRSVPKTTNKYMYEFKKAQFRDNKNAHAFDKLVVSNETDCDNLYEVFDALCLNPLAVSEIIKKYADSMNQRKSFRRPYQDSTFRYQLDHFKLDEFSIKNGKALSIFMLIVLYKASCPIAVYYDIWSKRMLASCFDLIRNAIAYFEDEQQIDAYYGSILYNQGKLMIDNIKEMMNQYTNHEGIKVLSTIASDELTSYVLDSIIDEINKYGTIEQYADLKQAYEQFKIAADNDMRESSVKVLRDLSGESDE